MFPFMLGLQSHEELSCHSLYSKKTTTPYDKESWLKVISNYEMCCMNHLAGEIVRDETTPGPPL